MEQQIINTILSSALGSRKSLGKYQFVGNKAYLKQFVLCLLTKP